jgi:hypothetical protein
MGKIAHLGGQWSEYLSLNTTSLKFGLRVMGLNFPTPLDEPAIRPHHNRHRGDAH